jgi:hypothetical protein
VRRGATTPVGLATTVDHAGETLLMRKLFVLAIVALSGLLAACNGAATTTDPYQIVWNARSATWDQVQVDLSMSATGSASGQSVSIQPGAIRLAFDTKAGKALVHVSLPVDSLDLDAATKAQLGLTGSTLDLDVLYDGNALYVKSPLAAPLVTMLFSQAGTTVPSGDLAGWLKLGTKADFEALAALGMNAAGGVLPSFPTASFEPFPSAVDAASLKTQLENMGIVLTYAGTEQHSGVDAAHLTATVDWAKLSASDLFKHLDQAQINDFVSQAKDATITLDAWFDTASGRFVGLDVHGSSASHPDESLSLSLTLKTPDAGTSFDAPASAVDVPVSQLLTQLLQSLGASLGGSLGGGVLGQ